MQSVSPCLDTRVYRRGLTLVEVVIALVLVVVGLLGIAGSSALLFRSAVGQTNAQRAIRRASMRMVRLAAAGCASTVEGSMGDPMTGIGERWHVSAPTNGALTIEDTLEWTTGGARRVLVVRSAMLC